MNKFFVITCILFTSCMSEKEMTELRKEREKPFYECREKGVFPRNINIVQWMFQNVMLVVISHVIGIDNHQKIRYNIIVVRNDNLWFRDFGSITSSIY
jgi:hypothetical protein